MKIRSVLLAATLLSAAGFASAQFNNPQATPNASFNHGGTIHANFVEAATLRYTVDMEALRKDALAQQALDGGVLTPVHRAQLQATRSMLLTGIASAEPMHWVSTPTALGDTSDFFDPLRTSGTRRIPESCSGSLE